MAEARPRPPLATWRDELASFVADPIGVASSVPSAFGPPPAPASYGGAPAESSESLRDQIKGFAMASAEIAMELGRGCRDIVRQSFLTEDSYLVRKLGKPYGRASAKLSYFNEFLHEDRDPTLLLLISLLEEFGIRLVTYDLPGFGESDPDPGRNLNSSALDMLQLANAIGVSDKFWVLAHSGGAVHALAALKYIPSKVAGAALLAPMMNPYDPLMTQEEIKNTWENWLPRRKFMYFLARRFPRFLTSFYRRSFLSGKLELIDKWLSLILGKKDEILIEEPKFQDLWDRNLEESIRQHNVKPFIEEAVMQVSYWGFRLLDLQVQRRCQARGLLPWLKSIYRQAECELAGFLGPIHIWQVVPPSMADYIHRVLPEAVAHKLGATAVGKLKEMKLVDLYKLERVWTGLARFADFSCLERVSVIKCEKRRNVFSDVSILGSLSRLEDLWIEDCKLMEEVIKVEDDIAPDRVTLPSLKTLCLSKLPKLKNLFHSHSTQECL